jgi:hypothetical protein
MEIVYITGALMIGLIIFATAYKYYEVRKASGWLPTSGKVLSARAVSRRVRTAETRFGAEHGADENIRNFAEIRYEYRVGGRRYAGSRISIGEDLGDHEVEETLRRYPRGSVVTVFYNPDKPDEAVLERASPEGVWRTMAFFVLVLLGLFIGGTLGFDRLVASLSDTLNDPAQAVPVAAFLGLAAFMMVMGLALRRQVETAQGWPTTMGTVETAQVESFLSYERKANQSESDGIISMRWQRYFRPDVVYRYQVDEMDYRGSRISLGGRLYASFDAFARRRVGRYTPGDKVTVYYDPDNPAMAVLEPHANGRSVVWILALMFLAAAGALALS